MRLNLIVTAKTPWKLRRFYRGEEREDAARSASAAGATQELKSVARKALKAHGKWRLKEVEAAAWDVHYPLGDY